MVLKTQMKTSMNKWIGIGCVTLALALALPMVAAEKTMNKKLQHVVAIKFKADASPEQIKKVEAAFRELKTKIPGIAALESGVNNSPEGKNKGFTHCFILTFLSEKDRDVYLPHPDHKAFGTLLRTIMDDVFVLDFWTE